MLTPSELAAHLKTVADMQKPLSYARKPPAAPYGLRKRSRWDSNADGKAATQGEPIRDLGARFPRKKTLGERQGPPRADLWIRRCNGLRLRSMRLSDENGRCRPGTSTLGDLQSTTAVPIPAASRCPRSAGPWAGHAIRQGSFRGRPLGTRRRSFEVGDELFAG